VTVAVDFLANAMASSLDVKFAVTCLLSDVSVFVIDFPTQQQSTCLTVQASRTLAIAASREAAAMLKI